MSAGPGVYDAAATAAMKLTDAETVVVIVLGGKHGNGFSIQSFNPNVATDIPKLLRNVAAEIEAG